MIIDCDTVVMAVGSVKNVPDLDGVHTPVIFAGDCSGEKTAGIAEAIRPAMQQATQYNRSSQSASSSI